MPAFQTCKSIGKTSMNSDNTNGINNIDVYILCKAFLSTVIINILSKKLWCDKIQKKKICILNCMKYLFLTPIHWIILYFKSEVVSV